jgi:hypothetical protein
MHLRCWPTFAVQLFDGLASRLLGNPARRCMIRSSTSDANQIEPTETVHTTSVAPRTRLVDSPRYGREPAAGSAV